TAAMTTRTTTTTGLAADRKIGRARPSRRDSSGPAQTLGLRRAGGGGLRPHRRLGLAGVGGAEGSGGRTGPAGPGAAPGAGRARSPSPRRRGRAAPGRLGGRRLAGGQIAERRT